MKSITPKEAFAKLTEGNKDCILVDVRESYEFNDGHAKGAKNYPLSQLSDDIFKSLKDYKNIYVICQSGARSMRAVSYFISLGLNAINVQGGTGSWDMQNLPMEF